MKKPILNLIKLLPVILIAADQGFANNGGNLAQNLLKSLSTWQTPLISKSLLTQQSSLIPVSFLKQAQATTLTRCNQTSSSINTGYSIKTSSGQWSQLTGWTTIKPQKCDQVSLGIYSGSVRIYKNINGNSQLVTTISLDSGKNEYAFR